MFLDQLEEPVEERDREATSTFFRDGVRKVKLVKSIFFRFRNRKVPSGNFLPTKTSNC